MDSTPVDPSWPAPLLPHRASSAERVLASLWKDGPTTVSALVDRTGLHPNTVRTALRDLGERGLSSSASERRPGRGRPRLVYEATGPAPTAARTATRPAARPATETEDAPHVPSVTTAPPAATRVSTDSPSAAVRDRLTSLLLDGYGVGGGAGAELRTAAVAAGRRLSDVLPRRRPGQPQLSVLTEVLDGMGFGPVVPARSAPTPRPTSVHLTRCPLLDLASARPEVVCSMHLGLVRQVLEDVGGPLRADDLVPFAGPLGCSLHLSSDEVA